LPRASDFKAKGFLDAYPYYYYFRGHPKVAEFFVRLQNMEEWNNLWIDSSTQTNVSETRIITVETSPGVFEQQEEGYSDWAIAFKIRAQWNPENAIWNATAEGAQPAGGGGE
jgi:hypothetical protein